MPPILRRTAAILALAFVVIPFALTYCCIFCSDRFSSSLAELKPAGLYPLGEDWSLHDTHSSSLVLECRYRIGMSRDEIRKNFAFGARLIASDSRPEKNWRAIGKGQLGLAYHVLEFEGCHRSGLVAAYDIYDDDMSHHVLFFDDAGILVGAQQFPSFICLSARIDSANNCARATPDHGLLFAVVQVSGAPDAGRSEKIEP